MVALNTAVISEDVLNTPIDEVEPLTVDKEIHEMLSCQDKLNKKNPKKNSKNLVKKRRK